jgi:hypothetical protein
VDTACDDLYPGAGAAIVVAEDASSLTVSTGDDAEVGMAAVGCTLAMLEVSDAVVARMDGTNSLMGWQEATENGLALGWSFHPDNGFLLTITVDD